TQPLPSSPAAPSFTLDATWYLICEAAAEETPALATANEKPKEGIKTENNNHINLKVIGQDGSVVQFKIKSHCHIPLSRIMKAYREQPVHETDTPAQLEMEDEDTIDVFQQQTRSVY
uniref:Rad60/SUMO-like domain-containing protein n=1 Tax=Aotus nancymaae TaxID=37293 RepID=A0A2K5CPM7_AOTNA